MTAVMKTDDPLFRLIRDGDAKAFNSAKANHPKSDLTGCDFRTVDFRGFDLTGLDFSNCYFRQADLRGVDFSQTRLEGASINGAKISGAYFPIELSADEIDLSLLHGTRMRYRK